MRQETKDVERKPGQTQPTPQVDVKTLQEKEEVREVAGRHKNSGQKDHKGAR